VPPSRLCDHPNGIDLEDYAVNEAVVPGVVFIGR
jgi:hypothetical protein